MVTGVMQIKLYAPFVHSLKDKRMIVLSLLQKIKNKFSVSAAEVAEQDVKQTIVIAVSVISGEYSHAQNMLDEIERFVLANTEAEVTDIKKEYY